MGLLTLLQIRTEVDSSMGNRTGVLDPRLTVWINLAYNEIASGIDFKELDGEFPFPTVIGQAGYAGPTNPLVIQMVRNEVTHNLLTWVPETEYFRLDRSANGVPRRWTRRGVQIRLWPPPSAIQNHIAYYKVTPTPLAADGDVTILPPYIDNALIFLSVAYGFLAVEEGAKAIVWLNRAITYLSSRITNQDFSFLLGGLARTQPIPATEAAPSGG
jgi:hypothetical protein